MMKSTAVAHAIGSLKIRLRSNDCGAPITFNNKVGYSERYTIQNTSAVGIDMAAYVSNELNYLEKCSIKQKVNEMNDSKKNYALLLDAENVNIKYIDTVMNESSKKGNITIRRVYGDVLNPSIGNLKDALLKYSIMPMQQFSYTKGKNSTDMMMAIDAMDMLYTNDLDGFIIVSSDSDFTRLAMRLRESGKDVVGMGKKNITPAPFINACNDFIYVDIEEYSESAKKKSLDKAMTDSEKELKKYICDMLEMADSEDGWVKAADLGTLIKRKYPDYDPRMYGCKKTGPLLDKLGFETKYIPDKNNKELNGKILYVRLK